METHVGFYFKKISEKLEKRVNSENAAYGITCSQRKLLWFLRRRTERGERVTLRDIEKFFDCSHATVSGLVARLAERGYVYTEPDEADRRAKVVLTTKKAAEYFSSRDTEREAAEESLLFGFSDREKEELTDYLDRIYKNLE